MAQAGAARIARAPAPVNSDRTPPPCAMRRRLCTMPCASQTDRLSQKQHHALCQPDERTRPKAARCPVPARRTDSAKSSTMPCASQMDRLSQKQRDALCQPDGQTRPKALLCTHHATQPDGQTQPCGCSCASRGMPGTATLTESYGMLCWSCLAFRIGHSFPTPQQYKGPSFH
jgi:hypothetical protein